MIRINLLPVRAKRKRNTSIYQIVAMTAVVAVSFLGAFALHLVYQDKVDVRAKKVTENQDEIVRRQKIIGVVTELDKQKQRLLSQLSVIDKLEKGKLGPVRVLDQISASIPKRVWITSFRETAGALAITGAAMDNSDISEFMRAMQKSAYFSNVTLKFSQSDLRDGVTIYTFEIGCSVNYQA